MFFQMYKECDQTRYSAGTSPCGTSDRSNLLFAAVNCTSIARLAKAELGFCEKLLALLVTSCYYCHGDRTAHPNILTATLTSYVPVLSRSRWCGPGTTVIVLGWFAIPCFRVHGNSHGSCKVPSVRCLRPVRKDAERQHRHHSSFELPIHAIRVLVLVILFIDIGSLKGCCQSDFSCLWGSASVPVCLAERRFHRIKTYLIDRMLFWNHVATCT